MPVSPKECHPAAPLALTTHHAIKLLALVLMTVDHLGAFIWPDALWLRAIGRIMVPVWFFLVGHALHYRVRRDLLLWAVAMQALSPFLGVPVFPLNVLVTLLFCQFLLGQVERRQLLAREPWVLMFACLVLLPPSLALSEYGALGFLYALLGYAVRSRQMAWRGGKAVAVLALVSYLAVQGAVFDWTPLQQGFVILATAGVTLYLARFIHRPLALRGWRLRLVPGMLFLSRHSMQYYVIHRLLLQGIGIALGTVSPLWRWI